MFNSGFVLKELIALIASNEIYHDLHLLLSSRNDLLFRLQFCGGPKEQKDTAARICRSQSLFLTGETH